MAPIKKIRKAPTKMTITCQTGRPVGITSGVKGLEAVPTSEPPSHWAECKFSGVGKRAAAEDRRRVFTPHVDKDRCQPILF
jgi:hypothetical protein